MAYLKHSGLVLLNISIAYFVLVPTFVLLRFYAKWATRVGLRGEDWLILLAMLAFFADIGVTLQGLFGGGGSVDVSELTLDQLDYLLFYLYLTELLAFLCISLVKLSILCLFETLFPVRSFKFFTLGLKIICILWWAIVTITNALQCNPPQYAWDIFHRLTQSCPPYGRTITGYSITNIVIDIAIICLPIHMVRKLQLPMRQKMIVGGILVLGGFTTITSAVRLSYLFDEPRSIIIPGYGDYLLKGIIWNIVELSTAIFCACLPTYGVILSKMECVWTRAKSIYGSVLTSFPSIKSSWVTSSPNQSEARATPAPRRPWSDKPLPPIVDSTVATSGSDGPPDDDNATSIGGISGDEVEGRGPDNSWYLDPDQASLALREISNRSRSNEENV